MPGAADGSSQLLGIQPEAGIFPRRNKIAHLPLLSDHHAPLQAEPLDEALEVRNSSYVVCDHDETHQRVAWVGNDRSVPSKLVFDLGP